MSATQTTVPQARLGALLTARMSELNLTTDEVAADVTATTSLVTAETVTRWMSDEPVIVAGALRALLATLNLSRDQVVDHIAPAALLPALWCRTLGTQLRDARTVRGLSLEDVAAAAGVSVSTVRRWETAHTCPRAGKLVTVLDVLGLTAAALLPHGDWPPTELPVGDRPAFATWLRNTRRRYNHSQSDVAKVVGVIQPVVQAWETGRTYPDRSSWSKIARRLTRAGYPVDVEQLRYMQLPEWVSEDEIATRPAFAQKLTRGRIDRRLSMDVFAWRCGVELATYRAWEAGTDYPRQNTWDMLTPALRGLGIKITRDDLEQMKPVECAAVEQMPALAALLAGARMGARLTQGEVADHVGASVDLVNRWEGGSTAPAAEQWPAVLDVLSLDETDVVDALQQFRFGGRRDLGSFIWARRTVLGLGRNPFTAAIDAHRNRLSEWESGRCPVPSERLERLADTLEVALADLTALPNEAAGAVAGAALRARRRAAGLSQKQVAKHLGMTQAHFSSYESGALRPTPERAALLEQLLPAV